MSTDQYNFIIDHRVMIKEVDSDQPISLLARLKASYGQSYTIESLSFDRGFYSRLAKEALQKEIPNVVMPRKGRSTEKQKKEEQDKIFQALRKKHSAVESNINELEHNGVNRVPDKGLPHFKNYVAMGVLAYNLKRLGKILIQGKKLKTLITPGRTQRAA